MGDELTIPRQLTSLIDYKCAECLDTDIALSMFGVELCPRCRDAHPTRTNAAYKLKNLVLDRLDRQLKIDSQLLRLAQVLTHFSSTKPAGGEALAAVLLLPSRRHFASLIETLRADWLLPIGSRLGEPSGLWIITDAQDFLAWHRDFRRRPITQIATAYKLMRANFPELAGQDSFEFVATIKQQIEEELQ